jgi:hypothetical protein
MTAAPAGTWRAIARGWPVFVPVIVVEAGVQTALVLSDPVPQWSTGFLALLLISLLALLAAVWLTVGAASAAVDGTGGLLRRAVRRPIIVAWALAVGVVAVAVSLLQLWVTPLVLLVGAFVLPAAAADDPGNLFARAYRPVVRTPVRWVLAVLAGVALAIATWVAALSFGFFITGALGAVLTWLWFGVAATFVIALWCSLYRRATPATAT